MEIEKILVNKYNFNKMTDEQYQALKSQIKDEYDKTGRVVFEIKVKVRTLHNGFYELIDGEHKVKACKELGISEIPNDMIEVRNCAEKEALLELGKTNTKGTEIEPFKEAEYINRLHESGMTFEEMGKTLGYSKQRVSNIHKRLRIPVSLRSKVSLAILEELTNLQTPKAMQEVIDWSLIEPRTREETRRYIASMIIQKLDTKPATHAFRMEGRTIEAFQQWCKVPCESHKIEMKVTTENDKFQRVQMRKEGDSKWTDGSLIPIHEHPISIRRAMDILNNALFKEWLKAEGYLN
jgi:ParB-like chromosome segregation protein Spo0J